MPTFEIVHPNTTEPEPVEKPVQFKMVKAGSVESAVFARQFGDWVLLITMHFDGDLLIHPNSIDEQKSLSGLKFDDEGRWEVYES